MITVPDQLASLLLRDGDSARRWIRDFPDLAEDVISRWHCEVDGKITAGAVAVIIPVRSPHGPAVIKLSYPHPGNADEHRALALWDGHGAVRLFDSDPDRFALLVERVNDRQLDLPADEGIVVGAELLARLAMPAPPEMKRLADTTAEWEQQVRDDDERAGRVLPGRVVDAAVETIRELGHDRTTTMLHGDLHGGNVLRSPRGWIVIDPKGMAGTGAFDALTMCSYRLPDANAGIDPVVELDRRVRIFSESAGVETDLSRRCIHARAVTGLLWDLGRGDVPRTSNFELRTRLAERLLD